VQGCTTDKLADSFRWIHFWRHFQAIRRIPIRSIIPFHTLTRRGSLPKRKKGAGIGKVIVTMKINGIVSGVFVKNSF